MMEKTISYSLEPWSFESNSSFVDICDSMGKFIADTGASSCTGDAGLGIENARRIVACVNACAGIDTEWLENNGAYAVPVPSLRTLLNQRDELLAALKRAEPLVEQTVDISGYKTHGNRRVWRAVRAAIAKCEEQS